MPSILSDLTPCGAMFEILKRSTGMSHKELASLVLSERPLSDGRSPMSRSADRTWLSRFVVNAPVGSWQPRYFRDYGLSAQRVMDRVRTNSRGEISNTRLINLICGDAGKAMECALAASHQDAVMYRNALERFSRDASYTPGERAETVMVLFVSVGCTANVRAAVAYTSEYVRTVLGGRMRTPQMVDADMPVELQAPAVPAAALGLLRVAGGYISGNPYWVEPDGPGAVLGSMAPEPGDITDVEVDVSAEHARVWFEGGTWRVCDLGSTNGTRVVSGSTGEEVALAPNDPALLCPGDELRLGAATAFMVVVGTVGSR